MDTEWIRLRSRLLQLCENYDIAFQNITGKIYGFDWMSQQMQTDLAWGKIKDFILEYPRFAPIVIKNLIFSPEKAYHSCLIKKENYDACFCFSHIRTFCSKCDKEFWYYIPYFEILGVKCPECNSIK